MYLKKLELLGFKSFAAKTTMDFPGGVTAIVGPNGSGKSNVIDAIRWIMGEREAKNIRAEKSENLIFSGTPQKTRAGFAQVTITFDNSSHFFPVDFSEVSIRRRVSRDGNSEYFLNDSGVRLRDVVDFFSQARLGTKGFAIINQGNSDLFVKATPEERRMMLEEVLGLRQFQIKRHEAESKLKTTGFNLEKVSALIEELLPHLRLLRRQAAKWEKHGAVEAELRQIEEEYFSFRFHELNLESGKIKPHLEKLEGEIKKKQAELKILEAELGQVEKNQPQGDKNFDAFRKNQTEILNRKSQIQKELGRLEAEAEFLLRRPSQNVKEAELLAIMQETKKTISVALKLDDMAEVKKAMALILKRIDEALTGNATKAAEDRKKEIEKTKNNLISELGGLEKNLAEMGDLEAKLAGELREFNNIFKNAFHEVEAKKDELNQLNNQKSRFLFDEERVALRRKDLENQIIQIGRKAEEFKKWPLGGASPFDTASPLAPARDDSSGKESDYNAAEIERRMLRLRGELLSIGEIDQAMIKDAKEMEARYEFLSTQLKDLEKASADLKELIIQLTEKIHTEFTKNLLSVNEEFNKYFRLMFSGGKAKLHLIKKPKDVISEIDEVSGEGAGTNRPADAETMTGKEAQEDNESPDEGGLEIELTIPRKNIKGLDMLSGGERSLVSIAVLFALISVSPPPFLVMDEVDAALDENNTKRFANLIKDFAQKTQFMIVTHNRATMEAANILYGVTMAEDGTSRLLSLKLDDAESLVTKP